MGLSSPTNVQLSGFGIYKGRQTDKYPESLKKCALLAFGTK